uniref:Uncharacterized protein n=1 Tax=Anguilla anguilla TaxID=7936 RepID=A0A0E9T919_ANGAN
MLAAIQLKQSKLPISEHPKSTPQ